MSDVLIDSPQCDVWEDMVARLGGAEALAASARQYGAFQRSRKVKSAVDLLRLVLAYGPGGRSLRVTAAEAAACEIADVCDVSLLGRFQRCAGWLTALCEKLLQGGAAPAGGGFERLVRLIDGSRIEGPGKTCWRLHLCYDVARQRIADFAVTPMTQGEKLERVRLRPGEIGILDRGYPHPDSLRKARKAGSDLLIRLTWNSLNLRDATNRPLDWSKLFAQAARTGSVDMPVMVHKPRGRFEPLPLRLVIVPKPPEIAATARKKAFNTARKNQHRADPRTLQAAEYLILITSLDATAFPPELLATLYRVRWQIELAFKRLKSILHLDRLPAKDPDLARAWITAHLLLALLIEDTTAELAESPPCGPPNPAAAFALAPNLRPRQRPARRHLAAAYSRPNRQPPAPPLAPTPRTSTSPCPPSHPTTSLAIT